MDHRDTAGDSPNGMSAEDGSSAESDLGAVDWRLTDMREARGELVPVDSDVLATATFADGRMLGSTGCNRYVGTCTLDGGSMRLTGIASTLRACPPPSSTVEAAFLAALERVTAFDLTGDRLDLLSDDGTVVLRFAARPAPPLIGTTWSAVSVNNGRGGVTTLVPGSVVTATFAADDVVTGGAGCNRFQGPYEVDGQHLRIGPLATTRMACPEPLMTQERAFLSALGLVTTFTVAVDRLELRSEDGALQAEFLATGDG